jgi:hypothetical protein
MLRGTTRFTRQRAARGAVEDPVRKALFGMPGISTALLSLTQRTDDLGRPPLPADPAVRATAAISLIAVGLVHTLEIQGQLSGAAWLTAGFVALAVAAPVAGLWLLIRPSRAGWQFSALACLLSAGGYVLTRSVPVPGDQGDRGNWLEPLGVTSLFTEAVVTILAVIVLATAYRAARDAVR